MAFSRRQIIAAAALVAALVAGCASSPDGPTDEEVLRAGDTVLAAVRFPDDWRPTSIYSGRAEGHHIRWTRMFSAPGGDAEALRELDRVLTEAGWKHGEDCMGPAGQTCFTYDRPGYHIFPSAIATVCADNDFTCTNVNISMSRS